VKLSPAGYIKYIYYRYHTGAVTIRYR